jgi:DNA repair protein RecO (recombination protein O)
MAIRKTEAFVLRSQPFRSSSLIVTSFTRSFGKVKGVVKGVRREGMVRPSTFEPFTLLEIVYYEKLHSDIHLISEASLLETYEGLRREIETLATAYYLTELVDQLTESQDPHEPIFELLHFAFQYLPSFPPSFLARFFEIRLLHEAGLLPHLESCLLCGEKNPEQVYFSSRQGAIFCPRCRKKSPEARPLSTEVLQGMRLFIGRGITEVREYSLGEAAEREMRTVVERFLADRLPRPLTTRRFLNQVHALKARSVIREA